MSYTVLILIVLLLSISVWQGRSIKIKEWIETNLIPLGGVLYKMMNDLRFRTGPWAWLVCSLLWPCILLAATPTEVDLRRDATVEAVAKVMPSVVNVATEEVVAVRDPLENLFRVFFVPYYPPAQ